MGLFALLVSLIASDSPAQDLREETVPLELNPTLTWDADAKPPRPISLVREGPTKASRPYAIWVAASEIYRDGWLRTDAYPYPGRFLERTMAKGPLVRLHAPQIYAGGGDFRSEDSAVANIRLAGVFRVLHIEPGFHGTGAPAEMLTLEPLEWFRRDVEIEGPYFLMVPGGSATVGGTTYVEGNDQVIRGAAAAGRERRPFDMFRPQIGVGDRVLVLESRPPVGPPRVLTTIGYALTNIAVLHSDGSADAAWERLPVSAEGAVGSHGLLSGLRRLLLMGDER